MNADELARRREVRGMADPLNRLRARNAARLASGDAEPIVAMDVVVPDEYLGLSASYLDELPRLAQGQAEDLKIDNGDGWRVWLSRVGVADGMAFDNGVSIEHYDGTRWTEVHVYEARP